MVLHQGLEQAASSEAAIQTFFQIDLFIHDSMHSEHNVRFELDSGGGLV